MKHLKKYNESVSGSREELVRDINAMFKFHSNYICGIEFDLNNIDEINDEIDENLIPSKFRDAAGFTAEENCERRKQEIKSLFLKYKGWIFDNKESLGDSKHDGDWHEFTIEITDPEGNIYIGRGDTCPAESPQINEISDNDEERDKAYKKYLKLKKKWNFN